nr:MAG TPA: hypothetical protein [Caudoviricetes sp.]DAT36021.1 MAG TPA: hypothetical protein [Caudoviricetes sp.]
MHSFTFPAAYVEAIGMLFVYGWRLPPLRFFSLKFLFVNVLNR